MTMLCLRRPNRSLGGGGDGWAGDLETVAGIEFSSAVLLWSTLLEYSNTEYTTLILSTAILID